MRIWGLHNDHPELDFVGNGIVCVGWDEIGDLNAIGDDKHLMKQRVAAEYPSIKAGAVPLWAGMLLRFGFEMAEGDLVVFPYKPDSTINIGRIAGAYYFDAAADSYRQRRPVEWLKIGVPRTQFSKSARYEIGSAITLFRVKNHEQEFLDFAQAPAPEPTTIEPGVETDTAAAQAEDEPNAERIETYTRDFIIETLMRELEGAQFEYFVAHLLEAMGYRTRVTQASGDGGFDIIAHRDPLGLEPPIIKVQCKRTLANVGAPTVQNLVGTLAAGGSELGLFVTLGSFARDAVHIGRTRQDVRLVNGTELVDLIFQHYDTFAPEWKRLLPLRSVYMVDREPEAG